MNAGTWYPFQRTVQGLPFSISNMLLSVDPLFGIFSCFTLNSHIINKKKIKRNNSRSRDCEPGRISRYHGGALNSRYKAYLSTCFFVLLPYVALYIVGHLQQGKGRFHLAELELIRPHLVKSG